MLWGFFKKVLVADSCAYVANNILINSHPSSISLWVGMIAFSFQIYGDFSGYSDIAIGCSKLFGVRLMRNFAYPYFARDIAEFWRRWHISLTTWFRDYLYIPLGGSRCSTLKKVGNTFAIFLVSGFWHGANWTFIAWGAFHAVCFLPLLVLGRNRKYISNIVAEGKRLPSFGEFAAITATFLFVVIGWTFFRAPDIETALNWLWMMMTFHDLNLRGLGIGNVHMLLPLVVMLGVEWLNRRVEMPILPRIKVLRWLLYYVVVGVICWYRPSAQTFIYFQF